MTTKWTRAIDKVTTEFRKEFGRLNTEELNWKPGDEVWSIAQNIDHLIVINQTYFPIITALHNGTYKAPWMSKIGFLVQFIGNTVLKAVQPDRRKKMKTFPIWEPSTGDLPVTILDRFEEHQIALKHMIESSEDLLQKNTVIASPANKHVVYTLEQAFHILVIHEQRHLEQAKEVYRLLKTHTITDTVI